jgi:2-iminobutanoate/2-iminopropanoate deaminase
MASGTPETRRTIMRSLAGLAAAGFAGLFGRARAAEQTAPAGQPAGDKPPLFAGSVTHNGLVYVAGKGEHGPGEIKEHTTSVLNQIEAELKKAGTSMEKVLKVNVYLHDIRDYDGMNDAYRGRFGGKPPVRTTVSCPGGIPGRSLVEIDCIAYI